MWLSYLRKYDPVVAQIILRELERQRYTLELIPSENFASVSVLEALGTILTNKYSEGYPGRRYYGGNEYVDMIENLAIERAKKLFKVPYVNVQPYSGTPANIAVYLACCEMGDTIMGLDLRHGGHLSHGWKVSFSGRFYRSVPYHLNEDGYIDMDEVWKLAEEYKPRIIWCGYSAYVRKFPFKEFSEVADAVGAYMVADIAHIAGIVAAGLHPSPTPYAHIITTTTHKTLRGPRGAMIMITEKGLEKDPELAERIDKAVFPGVQGGPHDHVTAAIAVALGEAMKPEFKEYAKQIVRNAKRLASELISYGYKLVTDGTDIHLMLVDLTPISIGFGAIAQEALELAGITVNKNTIPNEQSSPFYPSGIRLGTPAITTRGMREKEMSEIAGFIHRVLQEVSHYSLPPKGRRSFIKKIREELSQNNTIKEVREDVKKLCERFPLYPELR